MTTNVLLFFILIVVVLILTTSFAIKSTFDKLSKTVKENQLKIKFFLYLSFAFILFSIFAPYFFTDTLIGNTIISGKSSAETGDTIGGIMNPFVAIAAAILTFLAFWVQFKANQEVQKQFKIQQFESQFYEMLRLYRANVEEMKIKNINGRKCFARMLDEFKFIYYETEYYLMPSGLDEFILNEIAFYIFYYGVGNNIKEILYEKYKSYSINNEIDNLIEKLERYKEEHISQGVIQFIDNNGNSRNFNFNYIPFKGHVSRLDHYFRHLFQTVSYIVKNDTINEKEKYNYIKLLRAQLSNYEFIILYFNGLTDMGKEWVTNGYFTEYKFLKNLPYKFINYSVNPVDFLGMTNSKGEKIFDN